MEDKRRDANRGEHVPDVHLVVHLKQCPIGPRTRTHPNEPRPPRAGAFVSRGAWPALVDSHWAAPLPQALIDEPPAFLERGSPGVVVRPDPAGVASGGDQCRRPRWIGRGEERTHWAALRVAEERRPL